MWPDATGESFLARFEAGSLIGGYRLEQLLGQGGMACVFLATDTRLGRYVALKVLSADTSADQAFRRRFLRESRLAAAVDDPHVIPVHEAGEDNGVLYLAMRYVHGGDAGSRLSQSGRMSPARVAAVISPVASALDAAHAIGLVHRDVKPANVLIDTRPGRPDHVYLADFGIARTVSSGTTALTATGSFIGTLHYIAPEQLRAQEPTGAADQYALACTALELITGQPPFVSSDPVVLIAAHLFDPAPAPSARDIRLAAIDPVFARALSKDPAARYPTCRDFADDLRTRLGLAPYAPADPQAEAPSVAFSTSAPSPSTQTASSDFAPPARTKGSVAEDGGLNIAHPSIAIGESASPRTGNASEGTAFTDYPTQRTRNLGRRVLIPAFAICALGLGGFLWLHRTAVPRTPPSRPESILYDRGSTSLGSVSINPDSTTIAAIDCAGQCNFSKAFFSFASGVSRVYLWNIRSGTVTATIKTPGSDQIFPAAMAISPDGKTLATGDDSRIRLWNIANMNSITTIALKYPDGGGGVSDLAFSPDGQTLAVGTGYGPTYLYNLHGRSIVATVGRSIGGTTEITYDPNGKEIAAIDTSAGTIYIWSIASHQVISTFAKARGRGASGLTYSPSGKVLAVGDEYGHIYLWNMATKKTNPIILADPTHREINSLAFSPSGQVLAAGDEKGRIYLWNMATRKIVARFLDPGRKSVGIVAFSRDGGTLAATDSVENRHGRIYLWNMRWLMG